MPYFYKHQNNQVIAVSTQANALDLIPGKLHVSDKWPVEYPEPQPKNDPLQKDYQPCRPKKPQSFIASHVMQATWGK